MKSPKVFYLNFVWMKSLQFLWMYSIPFLPSPTDEPMNENKTKTFIICKNLIILIIMWFGGFFHKVIWNSRKISVVLVIIWSAFISFLHSFQNLFLLISNFYSTSKGPPYSDSYFHISIDLNVYYLMNTRIILIDSAFQGHMHIKFCVSHNVENAIMVRIFGAVN